ncbi:HD-GYP domain-containing protein [Desulfurivibrio alkaliphilus]|uniref:Metal dependent phosphohydrolase n=1 Tax=Desulfurivibrio alkaliphilus (strain DSM 19089 / UNIQEM U267 / AHT2) TaxID=589865 RepID=D6Z445_DESAT|nr:HD domain-containing protein [Desulfurivibrio alkaliphilus]ADH86320.1 metal dependent phosphohydrolase [Desulfurivibrio alkaliphilus AHT 2]
MDKAPKLPIDRLIEVVQKGGTVRTGVDVFNKQGILLLDKEVPITDPQVLVRAKEQGAGMVPINAAGGGGIWDSQGNRLDLPSEAPVQKPVAGGGRGGEIERRINEIIETKRIAAEKYQQAKACLRQIMDSIRRTGGEFDLEPVNETVKGLANFVTSHDNSFAYLTREIFSCDDYLYNHSVNVCTIGTVVLKKFNSNFSNAVNSLLNNVPTGGLGEEKRDPSAFSYFLPAELQDISLGFFLHDLGKVLIDPEVLNKTGRLKESEFAEVRKHVTEKARLILDKNRLNNPYIANICYYHHAKLYSAEERCYPAQSPHLIPAYVKVCKLADVYDAMTSKRCYREALNPVGAVTDIFNRYARKEPLLQYVLHSFVKSVGIYPPGSVVHLTNGQLCYVLESDGPVLLPLTDSEGESLRDKPELLDLSQGQAPKEIKVDRRRPSLNPIEAYEILPDYLRRVVTSQPS